MSRRRIKSRSSAYKRKQMLSVVQRDGWTCWICGEPIDPDCPHAFDEGATIDHHVPLSRGGSWHVGNLRLAHRCCNGRRGSPDVELAG